MAFIPGTYMVKEKLNSYKLSSDFHVCCGMVYTYTPHRYTHKCIKNHTMNKFSFIKKINRQHWEHLGWYGLRCLLLSPARGRSRQIFMTTRAVFIIKINNTDMYVCISLHVCIHMYMYTHIYVYINTCVT